MHPVYLIYFAAAVACATTVHAVILAVLSPTRHIPGPFLARFSRLWYFYSVWKGQYQKDSFALHRKYAKDGFYAPIVRLAPNMFSIVEPDKQVYGVGSKMPKGAWYYGWKHPSPDHWTLFPDQNIQRHADTRKKFQHIYSLSSVISYEEYIDECVAIFQKRLQELSKSGEFVNMTHWLLCYAFDVIGNITYGKRLGFLDEGRDIGGIMKSTDASMKYSTMAGIWPELHPYTYGLTQKLPGSGAAGRQAVMKFASDCKAAREAQRKAQETEGKDITKDAVLHEDLLDKMLNMKQDQEKGVTDYHVFMMGVSNLIGGSDSVAFSLSSVLHNLIRTPRAMQKLRDEIETKTAKGECEEDRLSFSAAKEMPYLQACITEALRLHPGAGLPLWRTVDKAGTEIGGVVLPAGSEVGASGWLASFDEDVWGKDAAKFRPERWLEAEKAGGDELKRLKAHYFPYGLGSRTCIGEKIANLEMIKMVAQLVRNFDFELESEEWSLANYWFVRPLDFSVRIKPREV